MSETNINTQGNMHGDVVQRDQITIFQGGLYARKI